MPFCPSSPPLSFILDQHFTALPKHPVHLFFRSHQTKFTLKHKDNINSYYLYVCLCVRFFLKVCPACEHICFQKNSVQSSCWKCNLWDLFWKPRWPKKLKGDPDRDCNFIVQLLYFKTDIWQTVGLLFLLLNVWVATIRIIRLDCR